MMEYTGKLYGKIGNKYFDTGFTSEDYDKLQKENSELQKQVLNLPVVMPCYLLQKVCDMYYGAYNPVKLFKTEKEAVEYALDNDILNYTIDEMSF